MGFSEQLKDLDERYPGIQWRLYNSMHYDCPVLEAKLPNDSLLVYKFREIWGDVPQAKVLERASLWVDNYLEGRHDSSDFR